MQNTTVAASGMNRKRATPNSITTGKNTIQIANVATVSGWITSPAPSRIATVTFLPRVRLRWMFSITTVALSTSSPIASASPPSVIRLILLPVRNNPRMPANTDNGIVAETMTVFRQLPRNTRISTETRIDEMIASWTTFSTAARTNTDWSKSSFSSSPFGAAAWISGSAARVASTTASVEASACLRIAR